MISVQGTLTADQLEAIQAAVASEPAIAIPVTRTVTEADAARLLSAFVWLLGYVEATRPGIPAFVDNAHAELCRLAGQQPS